MQHPHSVPRHARSHTCTPRAALLWSPRNGHLRTIQCLSGLSTLSKELYSVLVNTHNLLLLRSLGIAAEINEQEKDRVLNPSRCS